MKAKVGAVCVGVLLAAGCAAAPETASMSADDVQFLRFEYQRCFTLEDVEALRGFYLASFADEEMAARDRQFTEWWESQIERAFGPKPEEQGRCEVHDLDLTAGIARTSFGLRWNQITYVQDFDHTELLSKMNSAQLAELFQALEHPNPAPPTPHLRRGAALGCRMTSAFSWSLYCTACEEAFAAWRTADARQP